MHCSYVADRARRRCLQDYLCRRAEKHFIPKVDNTNVDRSVAAIHATVLGCLRQQGRVSLQSDFLAGLHSMPQSWAATSHRRVCVWTSLQGAVHATVLGCLRHQERWGYLNHPPHVWVEGPVVQGQPSTRVSNRKAWTLWARTYRSGSLCLLEAGTLVSCLEALHALSLTDCSGACAQQDTS